MKRLKIDFVGDNRSMKALELHLLPAALAAAALTFTAWLLRE